MMSLSRAKTAVIACLVVGQGIVAHASSSLLVPVSENESSIRPQRQVFAVESAPAPKNVTFQQRHIQAIDRALSGDTKGAVAILRSLLSVQMPPDERDRVYLSIGRIEYQAGNDEASLEAYQQVRKGGASWLEALEERASVEMRLGRPQETLASLKTVLSPLFENRVHSEPYFLAGLAHLRVCDYKAVFRTLDQFKGRFRDRVATWKSSSDPAARAKLQETENTIQKLNLVEAEAIQRLYIDESGKPMAGAPPKIEKESDQISFPVDTESDSKEVWVDEVDDYRVTTKGCPAVSESVAKKEN